MRDALSAAFDVIAGAISGGSATAVKKIFSTLFQLISKLLGAGSERDQINKLLEESRRLAEEAAILRFNVESEKKKLEQLSRALQAVERDMLKVEQRLRDLRRY